jgi:hypothetical protein
MQRLGFLKYLVWRASRAATNNLSSLGQDLISSVSQKVPATLTSELQEYFRALTDPIYRNLHEIASKPLEESPIRQVLQVEIQDVYLADSGIASRRGRLIKGDWNKYPYLAVELGLLRGGTFSLLVRGVAFLSVVSEKEIRAFTDVASNASSSNVNPLRLTLPQTLLLLFCFVEKDGDILKGLYQRLLRISEPFADWEAGDYLADVYRLVVKQSQSRVRSGDDLSKTQKLLDTADRIERWKGKPYKGKGARDEAATIRLEPFVDLGLLSKPDPFAYRYQVTDATRTFFEPLINAESIDYFLHHSFFEAANKAFNLNAEHRTGRETILPAIQKAYVTLKSPLGYVPILEVTLLAGIHSIIESGYYFEISEATDLLKALQKGRPELVRFNVDRWGKLTFLKFNGDITKVFGG